MTFPKEINSPEAIACFEAIKTGCDNPVELTDELMSDSDSCPLNEREMHWLICSEYLAQIPNPDPVSMVGMIAYLLMELRNERRK